MPLPFLRELASVSFEFYVSFWRGASISGLLPWSCSNIQTKRQKDPLLMHSRLKPVA